MDVTFADASLAALCNSENNLARRWGTTGRTVGRRLLELAASDAAALDRLPQAKVSENGMGETVIAFGTEIVIRGVIRTAGGPAGDGIVITGLDVQGGAAT
jgi:hypothetical protein